MQAAGAVIYLDLYFLVNFLMDFLLLELTGRLLGLAAARMRLPVAAAAGAVCACLTLISPRQNPLTELILFLMVPAALMLRLAFGRAAIKEFLCRLLFFWLLGITAGGLLGFLESRVPMVVYASANLPVRQWRLAALATAITGAGGLLWVTIGSLRHYRCLCAGLCRATLYYRGKQTTVTALWDTGNRLYEPYGHQPVHVITAAALRRVCDAVGQVIYIPFRTVGTETGIMPGIRIDRIEVRRDGRLIRNYEKPWLAVSRLPLSAAYSYEMLLHGDGQETEKSGGTKSC